jgi:hypothetical protein
MKRVGMKLAAGLYATSTTVYSTESARVRCPLAWPEDTARLSRGNQTRTQESKTVYCRKRVVIIGSAWPPNIKLRIKPDADIWRSAVSLANGL